MKLDYYTVYSRICPAIITSIPFILFNHFYINPELSGFFHTVFEWKWISNVSTTFVAVLLFSNINRTISKFVIEKRLYKNELYMPTTNLLLHSDNTYSESYKKSIYEKIFNDFGIKLLSRKEQFTNEQEARKKIVEAVNHIREKVKKGHLVAQFNREYGFIRNLIGGSIIGITATLFCIVFFKLFYPSPLAYLLSIIGCIIYSSIFIFHRVLLKWYGNIYAQRLFTEYLECY